MDLFALTRRLIDIESITPNEGAVGNFLCEELQRRGWEARKMPVESDRANVLATWPTHAHPEIVFSTHMDTVPPFIPSFEDEQRIYGRGSCDAKGIIAAQIVAAEKLRADGLFVGLLFLVGEERDSIGAKLAKPPFRNPFGMEIAEKICQPCWREAIGMGTKVINELRLPMSDPQAQKVWDQHIREFLNLT